MAITPGAVRVIGLAGAVAVSQLPPDAVFAVTCTTGCPPPLFKIWTWPAIVGPVCTAARLTLSGFAVSKGGGVGFTVSVRGTVRVGGVAPGIVITRLLVNTPGVIPGWPTVTLMDAGV